MHARFNGLTGATSFPGGERDLCLEIRDEGQGQCRRRFELAPGRDRNRSYSYPTIDACRNEWRLCLDFAKETAGIRDIEKLSGEAVRAYLVSKVDQLVAHATWGLSKNHNRIEIKEYNSQIYLIINKIFISMKLYHVINLLQHLDILLT